MKQQNTKKNVINTFFKLIWGSHGLMDRALDLKPEVTQGCGFESRLWQEVSTTEVRPLGKAPNPQLLPGRRNVGCPLLHLDGLKAENTFHLIDIIKTTLMLKKHLTFKCTLQKIYILKIYIDCCKISLSYN